jgi:branched-chain amino acid transport system ATP-binding protein
MTRLHLEEVSRSFGGLRAVNAVTMSVEAGRVVGLIGPNGAGKTSIVNLITGLLALDNGRITLDGHDISREEPHAVAKRGIARTFQNVRLMKEATVLDNVVSGLFLHDATSIAAKLLGLYAEKRQLRRFQASALELLERFGMPEYAHIVAGELPYGHQRRVEIMRAMVRRASVIVLDEPCAGMNDAEAEELGKVFRALSHDGLAVLLIEHNVRLVLDICEDIYVLASGEVIAHGGPSEIRRSPKVVEVYLGSGHA